MANNQILGIKSIAQSNKEHPLRIIRDIYELDWIFSTKLEKILLLGCVGWATYSVFKFILGVIF
jgi:hypothetical protein